MTSQFTRFLNTPLKIRNREISRRIVLAPMAGLGHIALRHLIDEYGGFGLLFTGMCSAKALPHENPRVSNVFSWRPSELKHLVCQIFGPDPESMAAAAQRIETEGFFGVDLNFGCSVAAICKKGCGAQLLKQPDMAEKIVTAVRRRIEIPLFVKFRTGWEDRPDFAVDMARRFEDAGADALTFHPRVAPDRRSRPPKWDIIGKVEKAVDIPVFGNGNLFQAADGEKMFQQTNCQGLALGRMAVARPWIFKQWSDGHTPSREIFYQSSVRYTQLLQEHFDDFFAVKFFKKSAPYFCANFKFGHQILKQLMIHKDMRSIQECLDTIFETDPVVLERPNQNLFL